MELARTQNVAEMSASLSQSIAEMNERIEHLFVVVERSSQPLFRKFARFIRNRSADGK
jgi:hypothetical protein